MSEERTQFVEHWTRGIAHIKAGRGHSRGQANLWREIYQFAERKTGFEMVSCAGANLGIFAKRPRNPNTSLAELRMRQICADECQLYLA